MFQLLIERQPVSHGMIECCGMEGTFKGRLVQPIDQVLVFCGNWLIS